MSAYKTIDVRSRTIYVRIRTTINISHVNFAADNSPDSVALYSNLKFLFCIINIS